jgi:hypothetical protein
MILLFDPARASRRLQHRVVLIDRGRRKALALATEARTLHATQSGALKLGAVPRFANLVERYERLAAVINRLESAPVEVDISELTLL